jgi:hypothetical protein
MISSETITGNHAQFHQQYIALRTKEQRVYDDATVSILPNVDETHIHYKEWMIRKHSARKII